jgi:NDP-sugar pyrophosphorylase family protein
VITIYKNLGFTNFIFLIRKDKKHNALFHKFMKEFPYLKYELVEDQFFDGGTGRGLIDSLRYLDEKFWVVNGDSWFEFTSTFVKNIKLIYSESLKPVIFVSKPNFGDSSNLIYDKNSYRVIKYSKNGNNLLENFDSITSSKGIDFGLIFLHKADICHYSTTNNKVVIDMGDIYSWLINYSLLKCFVINSSYIDIGTYKGWSSLSTGLNLNNDNY